MTFLTNVSISLSNHLKLTNAKFKVIWSNFEKEKIQAEHKAYIDKAKKHYDQKSTDSKTAKEDAIHKYVTDGFQKSLETPLITSDLSSYKRKLWTLTFTIHGAFDSTFYCLI